MEAPMCWSKESYSGDSLIEMDRTVGVSLEIV
jgi:hypothetical protein